MPTTCSSVCLKQDKHVGLTGAHHLKAQQHQYLLNSPEYKKPGKRRVSCRLTQVLLNLCFNRCFYATVQGTAFFGAVISNWTALTVTNRVYALWLNTVLLNQYLTHSVGTALRQLLVIGFRTGRVCMPFNSGAQLRVLLHELGQVLDVGIAAILDIGFVKIKQDFQLNANSFWLNRFFINNRCRLFGHNRGRLGSSTEVQANAQAGHPLGLVVIKTVQAVNASANKEIVAEVVLGTGTNHSHGGAIATITRLAVGTLNVA